MIILKIKEELVIIHKGNLIKKTKKDIKETPVELLEEESMEIANKYIM